MCRTSVSGDYFPLPSAQRRAKSADPQGRGAARSLGAPVTTRPALSDERAQPNAARPLDLELSEIVVDSTPAQGQGPAGSAQRDGTVAKAKHLIPPQTGAEAVACCRWR